MLMYLSRYHKGENNYQTTSKSTRENMAYPFIFLDKYLMIGVLVTNKSN